MINFDVLKLILETTRAVYLIYIYTYLDYFYFLLPNYQEPPSDFQSQKVK